MVHIIVKNYEHINSAFTNWDTPKGKFIKNKDHYDRTMKEQGMVSYEQMKQNSERDTTKAYSVSRESKEIIQAAKNSKDKYGKVKLSDRTIDALIKKGAIGKKIPSYMGKEYAQGFSL